MRRKTYDIDRRSLLQAGLAAAPLAAIGLPAMAQASAPAERKLGMVFPGRGELPVEAMAMYPSGVRFMTKAVGLKSMTIAGYTEVIDRVVPAARELAGEGAEAVILMGTSLSFYQGAAFNRQLADRMAQATGLPTTTMSSAIADGLRSVGAVKVAVATAYLEEVNERLRIFLREEGFDPLVIKGMGMGSGGTPGPWTVPAAQIIAFSSEVAQSATGEQGLLISCGALKTLEVLQPLEARFDVPVVSSLPHAIRAGVRLLGLDGRVEGHGRLLSLA